jgi:hypothetical protein
MAPQRLPRTPGHTHESENPMMPDKLLQQINELVETYAKAETCRAMAHVADLDVERANMHARAEYWDAQVSNQHAALTAAINSALPPTVYAGPDPRSPVRLPNEHHIDVCGRIDNGARLVAVRFTAAQAAALGTTLIACAAVGTDRLGDDFAAILPVIPESVTVIPVR